MYIILLIINMIILGIVKLKFPIENDSQTATLYKEIILNSIYSFVLIFVATKMTYFIFLKANIQQGDLLVVLLLTLYIIECLWLGSIIVRLPLYFYRNYNEFNYGIEYSSFLLHCNFGYTPVIDLNFSDWEKYYYINKERYKI